MSLGKARNDVAKRTLRPAGFAKGRRLFLRHADDQLHGIEYQLSKYGGTYYVNIGFGYDFLPSIEEIFERRVTALERYDVLDLMLNGRTGSFLPKDPNGYNPSYGVHDFITDESLLEQLDRAITGDERAA